MLIVVNLPEKEELDAIMLSMSNDAIDLIKEAFGTDATVAYIDEVDMQLIDEINEVAEDEGYEPFFKKNAVTLH